MNTPRIKHVDLAQKAESALQTGRRRACWQQEMQHENVASLSHQEAFGLLDAVFVCVHVCASWATGFEGPW